MTFILSLGNPDQVIQISDRRHTIDGRVDSDERNKATIMTCLNARLAIGFTGLARAGSFETQEWILLSLNECGPPDFTAKKILDRLCAKATNDFRSHPILQRLPRKDKRLSLMFSGYLYDIDPPLCVFALLTNYQDFSCTMTDSAKSWGEFKVMYYWEKRNNGVALDDLSMVQRIGVWPAWRRSDELALRPMLIQRKPAEAIALKGYTVVRDIARRPQAASLIGPQLTCIRIPRDPTKPSGYDYDTAEPTYALPAPDLAFLLPGGGMLFKSFTVEHESHDLPAAVPRVRPDQICPCGSRKRYKACHGVRGGWNRYP